MTISDKGIALIKEYEGCVLKVYLDIVGVPTSGYGHTAGLRKEDVGKPITQQKADEDLRLDLKKFEQKVLKYDSRYHWLQNEFDALCSFAFNIGSIDQLTANGTRSKQTIAQKMLEYNKAGGKVYSGLTKRRQAEHDMFVGKDMGIKEYSLSRNGEEKISEHFKVKEFKCKDGSDKILVDVDFVQVFLESIRNHFGAPITINSAYRTPSYNKKIGGATNSYHMKGKAFDIVVKGKTPAEVAKYAYSIGVSGVIQYNTFTHVDSRETKYYAINNNGVVTKLSKF